MQNICILCGTNNYAQKLYESNVRDEDLNERVFSARRLPDRLHGTILRCKKCGLVYASPLIDTATLADLYKTSAYTYSGEETYIKKTYARYLARLANELNVRKTPRTYLDIGCGNGFMLEAAKELGFQEVLGAEPSSHAIAQAADSVRGGIAQGMFSAELIGENRVDALTCFQTVDHITDPVAFVAECLRVLKPGGLALFINHNIGSFTARILGERCPMIDIEHTYLHTPQTMKILFEKEGFSDIRTFAVRNDYPIHYWAHLFPGPKKIKEPLISFLKKNVVGKIVIPLYAGNLGLIAQKPNL
ncbi:MAG: SAM-dependent methyltransferase [Candidatus Peribacteria bacterium]|nr:SAM-dependent methyltransferase [Candidatus Peribacteria bacterium]